MLNKQIKRKQRHNRVTSKMRGTNKVPRLCVFRSLNHIYAQMIDDQKGKTMIQAKDYEIKSKPKGGKVAIAYEVGKLIADKAKEKKITKIVFDRAGYKYHGRVKAIAEGAREGGLKF